MNDLNNYPTRLRKALNRRYETLSRAEQDDMLAEIESHIEEGLEDRRMATDEAQRGAKVLAELGEPTEMAAGLHEAHSRGWRELVWTLLPLAIMPLVRVMGWQIGIPDIPDALHIPFFMIFPLYLLFVLLVLYRQTTTQKSLREGSSYRRTK